MDTHILDIFNPDWWLNENNSALQITDAVLFLILLLPVLYMLIFGLASLLKYRNPYPPAEKLQKFLVLFTVFKKGDEVIESINNFVNTQQYPSECYDIAVAATQLDEESLMKLLQMPINIVVPDKEDCTKVYAIQQVIARYNRDEYDAIVIFNSDNQIVPNALQLFNDAYYSGCDSIQAHRISRNLSSSVSYLAAASEEISNRLFRKAHTSLGFSAALIGSGMMFDFEMAHRVIPRLTGADFATAMEVELLKENIFTEYLDEVVCYCNAPKSIKNYTEEHSRKLRQQRIGTLKAIGQFPLAFLTGKWDLCEKLFQRLMPSRTALSLYIIICGVTITIMKWPLCFKWWALLAILLISFLMALPEGGINKKFLHAIWALPSLTIRSIIDPFISMFKHQPKKKKEDKANKEELLSI